MEYHIMMRNIAIGLAAATIAIGGSTLSVSAHHGQESGISKGSMSGSAKSHRVGPRTYGFYDEERTRGIGLSRTAVERFAELTPRERERLSRMVLERFAELTPRERERLSRMVRERFAELTPRERARLGKIVRERFAELTPLQRERLSRIVGELRLSPLEREHLNRFVRGRYEQLSPLERERLYHHGPYGRR
jgi:CRP-like cAMP-binding protein